ncbi:MAG: glutamate racemase [Candidatus Omnitrophica bacterium]|nr:glutamate racemase [Candidatus Omnitrophota bacterium]
MTSTRNRPIGIFDSGIGGLTVVRSVRRYLPDEDIVYFGDTARVPYGNKSKSTVIRFSREVMDFMISKKVKMVIVACNTASSLSLASLKRNYKIPVIGVITPGAEEAIKFSSNRRIGVIGTNSTVASGAYQKAINKIDRRYKVFSKSCPLFVPLVENRFFADPITRHVARLYLNGLKKKNISSLILGCTHYPLLKGIIGQVMGEVKLVDSSIAVAKYAKRSLKQNDLRPQRRRRKGKARFYVSDDPEGFKRSAGIFLRKSIKVSKVTI